MEIKTVLSSVLPVPVKLAIFFIFLHLDVKKKYCFAIEC